MQPRWSGGLSLWWGERGSEVKGEGKDCEEGWGGGGVWEWGAGGDLGRERPGDIQVRRGGEESRD